MYEKTLAVEGKGIAVKKQVIPKENHGYWWNNLAVVEYVANEILAPLFAPTPLKPSLHYIKPPLTKEDGDKLISRLKPDISLPALPIRSKL